MRTCQFWPVCWSDGEPRTVTYEVVEDLVADDAGHFEALLGSDRVDYHVAMDADEELRVEDAVFILRRGESVSRRVLIIFSMYVQTKNA